MICRAKEFILASIENVVGCLNMIGELRNSYEKKYVTTNVGLKLLTYK